MSLSRWPVGEPFAVHPSMQEITLEVILRAVFGVSRAPRAARPPARPALGDDLHAAAGLGAVRAPQAAGAADGDGGGDRRAADGGDRRAARRTPGEDICSLLVQVRFEDGSAMTDREVRDQLMTLLLAGHETTATGLAWTLDLLTRHPGEMDRMRVDGEPYVRAVVAESLRLRPVVPLAGRRLAVTSSATACACPRAPTSRPRSGSPTPARTPTRTRTPSAPSASSSARPRPTPGSRTAAACAAASARRSRRWRCGSCSRRSSSASTCAPARARRARGPPQRHLLAARRHARHRHAARA